MTFYELWIALVANFMRSRPKLSRLGFTDFFSAALTRPGEMQWSVCSLGVSVEDTLIH